MLEHDIDIVQSERMEKIYTYEEAVQSIEIVEEKRRSWKFHGIIDNATQSEMDELLEWIVDIRINCLGLSGNEGYGPYEAEEEE